MKRSAPLVLLLSATLVASQEQITPPDNKYTPAQDVELGLQAAGEVRQQMPLMRDDLMSSYVEEVGRRLTAAIRPELRHPEFRYTFEVVNVREINAFALPGGPMFVNRGMIEAAKTEGEVAGVMAHELSHVVLRHGTAQASKATKYEVGQVAGAVLGAIIGGGWGQVISQGTQFGLGAAFMRFSREFERQADIEGSHILARAGIVRVDAMHQDQFEVFGQAFPPPRDGEPAALRETREFWSGGWRDPRSTREGLDLVAACVEARAIATLGDLPIHVLSAGTFLRQPLIPEALRPRLQDQWDGLQRTFLGLSSRTTQTRVENSGHFVQRDAPQAVVAAVLEVLAAVREATVTSSDTLARTRRRDFSGSAR